MSEQWNVGFFKCFEDIPTFLIGWCCPCYLFSQNATQTTDNNQWLMCCGYFCLSGCYACGALHYFHRQKLRAAYNLVEEPNDILASVVLSSCANCQEVREIEQRGKAKDSRTARTYQPS